MRLLVLLSLALAGCTDGSAGAEVIGPPDDDARFERVVDGFATVEACIAAQGGDLVFNCTQSLTLCANGRAEAIVTDIVGTGRHEVVDGVAHVMLDGFDGPPTFMFDLATRTSAALPGDNPWLVAADARLADTCAQPPR